MGRCIGKLFSKKLNSREGVFMFCNIEFQCLIKKSRVKYFFRKLKKIKKNIEIKYIFWHFLKNYKFN